MIFSYLAFIWYSNFNIIKNIKHHILHEDNHLLIVNKPVGLLSQKDITGDDSIIEIAKDYIKVKYDKPGKVFLGLAHRLDRPVSGAIILCRTSKSLTRINDMIKKRSIRKVYHAIIYGVPQVKSQRLVSYIKKNPNKNKVRVMDEPFHEAKEAILSYNVIKSVDTNTLVEIELETGRPHQIRSQLSHIGHPIVGDMKYGYPKPLTDKSIGLHAHSLEFVHPVSKSPLFVSAPKPVKAWWNAFV